MVLSERRLPVLVVGAGPAGVSAAIYLARAGRRVLLLDEHDFPRDKPCGDCLSHEAVQFITDEMDLGNEFWATPHEAICAARVVAPNGREFTGRFRDGVRMCTVDRRSLDTLLQKRAVACGARFRHAKVRAPLIRDGVVRGVCLDSGEEVMAYTVIAADGANSVMARKLSEIRLGNRHRALAIRCYAKGLGTIPQTAEYIFHKSLLPGYGWIFPMKGGLANVGCGASFESIHLRRLNLKSLLDTFLNLPEIKARTAGGASFTTARAWPLNAGSQTSFRRSFPSAMLIGDAGAFVSPLEGEGIYYALLSGKIAAETVLAADDENGKSCLDLHGFDDWFRRDLLPKFRASYAVQRIVLARPSLLNAAVWSSNRWSLAARTTMVCGDYL